jgi:cell division septation protein DedD
LSEEPSSSGQSRNADDGLSQHFHFRGQGKIDAKTPSLFKKGPVFSHKNDSSYPQRKPVIIRKRSAVDWVLIAKKTGGFVLAALQWLGAFLVGTLARVNFRSAGFRRGLSWLGSVCLLVLLFSGIHFLNARREIAMKTPARPAASTTPTVAPAGPADGGDSPAEPVAAPESPTTEDSPVDLAAPVSRAMASEPAKGYGVQIVTYVSRADAEELAGRVQQAGFSAFVRTQTRSEGKFYYRVFLGPYEQYRQAQDELAKFKKADISKPFQDAFVLSFDRRPSAGG